MSGMKEIFVTILFTTAVALGQNADLIEENAARYAKTATIELRSRMVHPTSFIVLEVKAIASNEKGGRTTYRGCIHYVSSNVVGGSLQRWATYLVDEKGNPNLRTGRKYGDCHLDKNSNDWDVTDIVLKYLQEQR
jgi:hypothetical protein